MKTCETYQSLLFWVYSVKYSDLDPVYKQIYYFQQEWSVYSDFIELCSSQASNLLREMVTSKEGRLNLIFLIYLEITEDIMLL